MKKYTILALSLFILSTFVKLMNGILKKGKKTENIKTPPTQTDYINYITTKKRYNTLKPKSIQWEENPLWAKRAQGEFLPHYIKRTLKNKALIELLDKYKKFYIEFINDKEFIKNSKFTMQEMNDKVKKGIPFNIDETRYIDKVLAIKQIETEDVLTPEELEYILIENEFLLTHINKKQMNEISRLDDDIIQSFPNQFKEIKNNIEDIVIKTIDTISVKEKADSVENIKQDMLDLVEDKHWVKAEDNYDFFSKDPDGRRELKALTSKYRYVYHKDFFIRKNNIPYFVSYNIEDKPTLIKYDKLALLFYRLTKDSSEKKSFVARKAMEIDYRNRLENLVKEYF